MRKSISAFILVSILLSAFVFIPIMPAMAGPDDIDQYVEDRDHTQSLSAVYREGLLSGTWEWVRKFAFISTFSSFLISLFGFLALAVVLVRRVVTITYLASRGFWDNVHENQDTGMNSGTGMTSFYNRIMGILPDLKSLSDYNGRAGLNLSEEDDIWSYMIKVTPQTIGIVLFSVLAWNGTLGVVYAEIADGIGAAFAQVPQLRLEEKVTNLLVAEAGEYFNYASSGLSKDEFKQDIAVALYRAAVSESGATRSEEKKAIADEVRKIVENVVPGGTSGNAGGLFGIPWQVENRSAGSTEWQVAAEKNRRLKDHISFTIDQTFNLEHIEVTKLDRMSTFKVDTTNLAIDVGVNNPYAPGKSRWTTDRYVYVSVKAPETKN